MHERRGKKKKKQADFDSQITSVPLHGRKHKLYTDNAALEFQAMRFGLPLSVCRGSNPGHVHTHRTSKRAEGPSAYYLEQREIISAKSQELVRNHAREGRRQSTHLYTDGETHTHSSPAGIFSPSHTPPDKGGRERGRKSGEKRIAAVHLQIIFAMRCRQRERILLTE